MDLSDPASKMSSTTSSNAGLILMSDTPRQIRQKIGAAVTDGERDIRYDPQTKPGLSHLLTLLSALTGTPVAELESAGSGHGYGHLKAQTAEAVLAVIEPFQQRMTELLDDRSELDGLLRVGAERAREVAAGTLARVRERVGLLARSPDQAPGVGIDEPNPAAETHAIRASFVNPGS